MEQGSHATYRTYATHRIAQSLAHIPFGPIYVRRVEAGGPCSLQETSV